MTWHEDIDRKMPWKETDDPYKIWISEIVLQQTRVAQGTAYYNRLIDAFPTVQDLAGASEDKVLSLWKGLGYYARARNLHHAAKQIVEDHKGVFPTTYEDIISLKGVGVYTAAAIASFAFDLPYAVVDGNVYRVLSRYFNLSTPIDTTVGKKEYATLAQEHLVDNSASKYNQAIMDFGALHCTPVSPNCGSCMLRESCGSYAQGTVDLLPIKEKKLTVKSRFFNYMYFRKGDKVLMKKRIGKDIWQGLYELPMIESHKRLSKKEVMGLLQEKLGLSAHEAPKVKKLWYHEQRLTHRLIHGTFYELSWHDKRSEGQWVSIEECRLKGIPKIIDLFFEELIS